MFSLRSIGTKLLLILSLLVVSPLVHAQQDKLDPSTINFAGGACSPLQYYSPFDNTCHGLSSGIPYPPSGLVHSTGSAWDTATFAHIVALFGGGTCSGFLKYDGTCGSGSGGTAPINGVVDTTGGTYNTTCGLTLDERASGSTTINLPAVSSGCGGIILRGPSAGVLTITPPSGVSYDGVTTQLPQGQGIGWYYDGTQYHATRPVVAGTHCTLTPSLTVDTLDCSGGGGATTLPLSTFSVGGGMCAITDSTGPGDGTITGGTVAILSENYNGQGCAGYEYPNGWYTNDGTKLFSGNSTWVDIENRQLFAHEDPPDLGANDYYFEGGGGDIVTAGIHVGGWGSIGNPQATLQAAIISSIMWAATPKHGKIFASNTSACSQGGGGTWTVVNPNLGGYTPSTGTPLFNASLSGTTSATLTCTTGNASSLYLAYLVDNSSSTATIAIDGGAPVTLSANAAGGLATNYSTTMAWGQRFALTGTGTHTFVIAVTAGTFTPMFYVTPNSSTNFVGMEFPNVYIGGLPYSSGESPGSASTWDGWEKSVTVQAQQDGFHVKFANLRAGWPESQGYTQFYEYASGTYPFGMVCTGAVSPHYNDCGNKFNAWQFLKKARRTPSHAPDLADDPNGTTTVINVGDQKAVRINQSGEDLLAQQNTHTTGTQTIITGDTNRIGQVIRGTAAAGITAPTVVQSVLGTGGSSGLGGVCTMSGTFTAGNTILVFYGLINTNIPNPPQDTLGNTFTLVTNFSDYGGGIIFAARNITGGSDVITTSVNSPTGGAGSNGCYQNITREAIELSNVNSTLLDGTPVQVIQSTPQTSPYTQGPLTTNFANDMVVAIYDCPTVPVPAGYTQLSGGMLSEMIAGTTGPQTATYTMTGFDSCERSALPGDAMLLAIRGLSVAPNQNADLVQYQNPDTSVAGGIQGNGHYYHAGCSGKVEMADGSGCATPTAGGSGTVNTGTTGKIAYYPGSGPTVSPTDTLPTGTKAGTPSGSTDVANKAYVDTAVAGVGGGGGGSYPALVSAPDFTTTGTATAVITGCITSAHRDYLLGYSDIITSAAVIPILTFSVDNGATWDITSTYGGGFAYHGLTASDQGIIPIGATSGFAISALGQTNVAGSSLNGTLKLYHPLGTSNFKWLIGEASEVQNAGTSNWYEETLYGRYINTQAINAVKLSVPSGTMTGTFTCQPLP